MVLQYFYILPLIVLLFAAHAVYKRCREVGLF
jgi:hypothetical protein